MNDTLPGNARNSRNRLYAQAAFNVFFLLVCAFAYRGHLNDPPSYYHAWAQADRYSMALKFKENGLNLFDPQSHNLTTPEGRTPAELPLHSYIPAVLMKVFDAESPAFMRGYTLVMSILGLNFLFLLAWRFRPEPAAAMLPPVFLFLSPVYFYYQANMLPGVPAFAMTLAAGWLVLRSRDTGKQSYWIAAAVVFGLAALTRIPMLMYFLAVAIWRLWFHWRDRKTLVSTLAALVVVCGLVAAQHVYNSAKAEELGGSIFLGSIMPFESLSEARSMFLTLAGRWSLDYFSLPQWLALFALLLFGFAEWRQRDPEGRPWNRGLLFLWTITAGGVLAYSWLMGKSFKDHDYFAIGVMYPGTMMLMLALSPWAPMPRARTIRLAGAGLATAAFMALALINFDYRTTSHDWDGNEAARLAYTEGDKLLEQLDVPQDARVLALRAWNPNQMLLELDRDGFTVFDMSTENIGRALDEYAYDVVVAPVEVRREFDLDAQLNFGTQYKELGSNGKIAVYAPIDIKQR